MECHYHPDRAATDSCAICGKSICKECGLEIAGKIYCKECLEKIVGLGIDNSAQNAAPTTPEPIQPVKEKVDESVYQPQAEYDVAAQPQKTYAQEPQFKSSKSISSDSPYNIKDSIEYSGSKLESSYLHESEAPRLERQPEVTQNENDSYVDDIIQQPVNEPQEVIYPDHDFEPDVTSARQDLEDKYEKYLDDLYFDEVEVPLNEQLAKDEAQYGSLTRKPYEPKAEKILDDEAPKKAEIPKNETPEEMEARIRAEIANEMKGGKKLKMDKELKKEDQNIHNLNYKDEKEPMGIVDILLTILLILIILVVLYYLVYLFFLSATYPTFMDAIFALANPQNVINNVLSK